jgi:putative ATP-binding cassette transporter
MKEQSKSTRPQVFLRLLRSANMFLKSPVGGRAKGLLAALLFLMLCINGMNVLNSFVGRYFMSAIEKRDMGGFVYYAWLFVAVFAGSTVVAIFFRFAEERLGLLWRDWLTRHIVGIYIDKGVYLNLEGAEGLTNPDQRMSEDVRQLTTSTLSFLLMILNGTVTAISFAGVLWSISPTLFIVSVVYAALGSTLTIYLGRPLIRLNYQQADYEANFRSELIRVRENADGIAMSGNQSAIRERLMRRIDQLVANFRRITAVNRNLGFFTSSYNYMIQLIPTLIVAPLFINHGVEFGVIGQSAMAFATLVAAFSLIVTQFQAISVYASVVTRLSEFVDAAERSAVRNEALHVEDSAASDGVTYTNLTLRRKDKDNTILIKALNASLVPGKRVLIHGSNQAARLALFRASANLYDVGSGTITRPAAGKLAFLPEQPYLPLGTVREVVLPKGGEDSISNQEIARLFEELGLESSNFKTLEDFETSRNWEDVLSFSKQKLMSVTRAILARPDFIFFDNLGAALTGDRRKKVLSVLDARGITCISFAEESPDPDLCDAALELRNDGSWEWREFRSGRQTSV